MTMSMSFLANHTATQYDWLLARYCCLTICHQVTILSMLLQTQTWESSVIEVSVIVIS